MPRFKQNTNHTVVHSLLFGSFLDAISWIDANAGLRCEANNFTKDFLAHPEAL